MDKDATYVRSMLLPGIYDSVGQWINANPDNKLYADLSVVNGSVVLTVEPDAYDGVYDGVRHVIWTDGDYKRTFRGTVEKALRAAGARHRGPLDEFKG